MDAERYRRAKSLFLEVCDLAPAERAAAVDRACSGDDALRAEVEAMIAFDARSGSTERSAALPTELAPGSVLDERFEIRALIGTGGLGEVWSAEQRAPVQRTVAIKVVKLGMDTRQVLARFEAERRTLAILDHPHIAHVLDAGSTPAGRPYFAMELIEGTPITTYAERARLGLRRRLVLMQQLCHAIQHAHQKGVIHRDLKPSNVLVTEVDGSPFVKVIDFGIAKAMSAEGEATPFATLEHQIIGTPAYMSPEQARNTRDVDTRTDVWALGVILHELLVGSTPFAPTRELGNALVHVLDDKPTPRPSTRLNVATEVSLVRRAEVKGDLDWIVLKALEKDRERRYPSAAALADDIERHLRHEPVVAGPPSRSYRIRKFVRRNRAGTAAAAAVFVALVAGITTTTIARNAEHAARVEAVASLAEADSAGKFLGDLLSAADPNVNGRDVRVVDMLQGADATILERFQGRPRAEIRVRRILGTTLRELGQLDDALVHQERAFALARSTYPADHSELLGVTLSLAALYDEMARFLDSEPLHRELIAAYPRVHGVESRSTLGAQCNFGLWLYDQARYAEAEVMLRSTMVTMEQHLKPHDSYLLNCMQGLGNALMEEARFGEAGELFSEVLRRADAENPGRSPNGVQSSMNLALLARRQKDPERALQLSEDSMERTLRVYGAAHWRTGKLEAFRAACYHDLGRTADERAALVRAHANYVQSYGADHEWTLNLAKGIEELSEDPPR